MRRIAYSWDLRASFEAMVALEDARFLLSFVKEPGAIPRWHFNGDTLCSWSDNDVR